jgi:glycosyltransferase involved in cell wall biosynthesis
MAELYDAADIFLNGSEIDSMPISILEAMASGLAVVTTDAGGIPWIVADGQTGLVVRRGDHQGMAEAALDLLADQRLASQLTDNARRECEKYSWDNVRDEWLKVYGEVLHKEPADRRGESKRPPLAERRPGAEGEAQKFLTDEQSAVVAEQEAVSR